MTTGTPQRPRRKRKQPNIVPGGMATSAYRPLSEGDIQKIHNASLTVLKRTGIQVQASEARDIFEQAGARIDAADNRVYIPPAMVEDAIALAANQFVLAGRDPKHDLQIGGERVYMGTGGAAIKVLDLDGIMRASTLADIARIGRLVDALNNIHFFLRPVVARDIPKEALDINTAYAALRSTSKHIMTGAFNVESAHQIIDMVSMIMGSKAAYEARPILSFTACWVISPLRYAADTVEVMIELVRQNIPLAMSSAPQSGATSPAALAGTLVQINAEQLSGVVLANLVRPAAKVLMGYVPSVSDIRTGNFVGGAPEFALMNAAAAQLGHFYNIPVYNSSSLTDSKVPDVQSGYEKGMTAATAALAGSNYIHHSAGFLASMVCVAYEQYVIDDDINGSVMRLVRGIEVNDDTLSVDTIDQACRNDGHYIAAQQTLDLMNSEYYYPHTGDRSGIQQWVQAGSVDMRERARLRAHHILETHQPEPIDPQVERAIREKYAILVPPEGN